MATTSSVNPAAPLASTHLLIPFAYASGFENMLLQEGLVLPNLVALTKVLTHRNWFPGDELAPSLPHEHLIMRHLGIDASQARPCSVPSAALYAIQSGRWNDEDALHKEGWAFITPCHWHVTPDRILMQDPAQLQLSEPHARSIFGKLRDWFAQDGIALIWDRPDRWLAHSPLLANLTTANIARVAHRDVRQWLPGVHEAPELQRLQTECQMLLYQLPEQEERAAQGLPPVNAFWVSGTGCLLPPALHNPAQTAPIRLTDALDGPAVNGDWHAWKTRWESLDQTELADLLQKHREGRGISLTLSGERNAVTLHTRPVAGLWPWIQGCWQAARQRTNVIHLLQQL